MSVEALIQANAGWFRHLLLVKSGTSYQASLQMPDGTCRIAVKPDPAEALVAVFYGPGINAPDNTFDMSEFT